MSTTSETAAVRFVGKDEGQVVIDSRAGGLGVITKLPGAAAAGAFCAIEHPLEPLALGSPRHTHHDEDEMSFVLEGEVMVEVGGEVYRATAGDLIFKPRGIPHAFWNPGLQRARILEIIAPAAFEGYFEELGALLAAGGPPDPARLAEIAAKYDLEMDRDSVAELAERYHLRLGPPPKPATGA